MLRRSILSLMLVNFSFGLFAKDKLPTKGLANINVSQIEHSLKKFSSSNKDSIAKLIDKDIVRHQGKIKIP